MALKPGVGLDKWEIAVAKKLVGEFRRRSRILGRHEFDDLVQDGLLHLIGVRRKLAPDPDKPPVGYMAQVLRNKLTDLKREHRAEKRAGDLGMVSLSATIDGSRTARQWPNPWLQPSSRNRRRAVMPANAICLLIHWAHWLT
jgi:DNA-directed RNA polymerase specialized sigma24 family protein